MIFIHSQNFPVSTRSQLVQQPKVNKFVRVWKKKYCSLSTFFFCFQHRQLTGSHLEPKTLKQPI